MAEETLPVVRQHYISQGILKLFSDNQKSVFEFNVHNNKIYREGISTTMSDKYTYEHPFLEGNALENAFKGLEDVYIPKIKEIIGMLDNNCIEEAKTTIESIMKYILLFYYRSGAILCEFSDHEEFSKTEIINNMLQRIGNTRYLEKLAATIICDYHFLIVKSPGAEFALSDQYVSTASLNCKGMITNCSNRTIGFSECIILIPLSAQYYAVYYNGNFSLRQPIKNDAINILADEDVIALNRMIVRNSYNKCIAMHQRTLESVKSYKSTIAGPAGIIVKQKNGSFKSYTIKKEVFFYDRDEDLFNNYVRYYSEWVSYERTNKRKIGRNDACICGSGKKYKKCCINKYQQAVFIASMIQSNRTDWMSTKSNFVEMPINEFWGLEANLPKHSQEIIKGLRELNTDGVNI